MNTTQYRRWIARYGNLGLLMVCVMLAPDLVWLNMTPLESRQGATPQAVYFIARKPAQRLGFFFVGAVPFGFIGVSNQFLAGAEGPFTSCLSRVGEMPSSSATTCI